VTFFSLPSGASDQRRMPRTAVNPKPSQAIRKRRMARVLTGLARSIPEPRVELNHRSPLELLIATILSAQCTDQRVNQVTPALFKRFPTARHYAAANPVELESMIRSTGFYKAKTRSIIACGKALTERFQGQAPATMEELVTLPGVGRKTANVILGACFEQPAVVVDTHVKRVAQRLGLTSSEDPDQIEQDLQRLMPPEQWTAASQRLLLHGRYVCLARRPRCEQCVIYADCVYPGKIPR
jgi:endonuclease-3